jgi:hypothetical protein
VKKLGLGLGDLINIDLRRGAPPGSVIALWLTPPLAREPEQHAKPKSNVDRCRVEDWSSISCRRGVLGVKLGWGTVLV